MGANFEMLTRKSKLKLKLDNDLSKKLQFSTDFSQNFTKHPSTIVLPWQQWMSDGTGLCSAFKPIRQFYRIKGRGGSGRPPTDNFLTVNFTPTNYILLKREFNCE